MAAPFPSRPALSGEVRSGGRPLGSVRVTIDTWLVEPIGRTKVRKEDSLTTWTDAAGRWRAAGESRWAVGILAPDGLPVWSQEFEFKSETGAATIDAFEAAERWREGATVERGGLALRLDGRRRDGPMVLPAFGVMAGKGQTLGAYAGGLLVLAYQPVRWALKIDGEVGLNGLAGFSGFAVGAPTGSLPLLDVDLGGRIFHRWTGDANRYLLGPAVSFGLANLRIFLAALRATAGGRHETALQVHVGFGYM